MKKEKINKRERLLAFNMC